MDRQCDVIFKNLLAKLHKNVLKPNGYKKTDSNFRLFHPNGLCKIINFQKSLYSCDGEIRFTVNVGLYNQQDLENPNLRFKEYECKVRTRVRGVSNRYDTDKWWTITEGTDVERIYAEFETVFIEDVLPWLDQFSSWDDVIRLGRQGGFRYMFCSSLYW